MNTSFLIGSFAITLVFFFFFVAQMVKNLPAMQETQVQYLGQEGLLKKGMATYSSNFPWRIPWTEEPAGIVHGFAKSWAQQSD